MGVSNPDSTTILVNSSTNRGTPSVLATICCTTSGGRALPPVTRSTIASTWLCPKRLSVSWLRCDRLPQGGVNSGRKVSSTYRLAVGAWSTTRVSTSSVEGSAQCTSSQVASTVFRSASANNHTTNASWVFCFCFCGLKFRGG